MFMLSAYFTSLYVTLMVIVKFMVNLQLSLAMSFTRLSLVVIYS